jgi:DNA-binding PucR family transcriptional regulator
MLRRIRELTGLNLDDGRTRLTLHLGLAMTDLYPM